MMSFSLTIQVNHMSTFSHCSMKSQITKIYLNLLIGSSVFEDQISFTIHILEISELNRIDNSWRIDSLLGLYKYLMDHNFKN